MNIQGLEALATLASAVPAPVTTTEPKEGEALASTQQQGTAQSTAMDGTQHDSVNQAPAPPTQGNMQAQMLTPQMWQQLMASATSTALSGGPANPALLSNLPGMGQIQMGSLLGSHQNVTNLQRFVPQTPKPAQSQQAQNQPQLNPTIQALSMALGGINPTLLAGLIGSGAASIVPPQFTPLSTHPTTQAPMATPASNTPTVQTTTSIQRPKIAPQPIRTDQAPEETDIEIQFEDKKLQKRVANRRSAQLSRKRKKQFIEELKDENDGLRRKEQILRSIPDLVVVFDSSGKLWFVSESVNRFLDFAADELEGSSFWNLMCSDSVKLLKAAFMDSLAAREGDSETAPLGQGFWDVRLKNKDGTENPVSLNGVVHFAGDRPECVCSIRPKHERTTKKQSGSPNKVADATSTPTKGNYAVGNAKPSSRISDSSESGSSDERCI